MPKFKIFIQARMSSKRLPKKMLYRIGSTTLLERVVQRISLKFNYSDIVVLTSSEKSDTSISKLCFKKNITCFKGDLNNVYKRFHDAINTFKIDFFVRICGDSPLIDPFLIEKSIELFKKKKIDIVTNINIRSYPKGQSVEVISSSIFLKTYPKILKKEHMEHITQYFYDNQKKFTIVSLPILTPSLAGVSMVVDTINDLKKIRRLINDPRYGNSLNYNELASLISEG